MGKIKVRYRMDLLVVYQTGVRTERRSEWIKSCGKS